MSNLVAEWQKEFRAGQVVYATWYRIDGIEEMGDLYDSEEGARFEVEWCKKNREKLPRVAPIHIHTLKLAKERWNR